MPVNKTSQLEQLPAHIAEAFTLRDGVYRLQIDLPQDEMDARRALNDACTRFANPRPPVRLFVDSPFYCKMAGMPIAQIFDNPVAMVAAQLLGWKRILEAVPCDVADVPVGLDFGSFMNASSYGCEVLEQAGSIPGFEPWFTGEADLARLEEIDPSVHGWRATERRFFEACHAMAGDFSVQYAGGEPSFPLRNVGLNTSSEGPFSLACMIAGFDRVSMWCYDEPELVTRLVAIITEKEIARIRQAFATMGEPVGPLAMADDFSPYLSVGMYEDFILPAQQRLRDAFGDRVYFHSCIPDPKLLAHWRDALKICLFNGFKPQHGLHNLTRDYTPVADAFRDRQVLLEPDMEGANLMSASADDLRQAATAWMSVFEGMAGVTYGVTVAGGHRVDDLQKLRLIHDTVRTVSGKG